MLKSFFVFEYGVFNDFLRKNLNIKTTDTIEILNSKAGTCQVLFGVWNVVSNFDCQNPFGSLDVEIFSFFLLKSWIKKENRFYQP